LQAQREESARLEERVRAKEGDVERQLTELGRREQGLADRETHARQLQEELRGARDQELKALERISSLTSAEAKAELLQPSAKLIEDGRIHPARIEEMYYQSKAELDEHIRQAGEQAVFEANCGELHEDLVKILGRLRYRTSYGQNVLKHTLEVVHLAGLMAHELEASVKTTKRAALLHALGKAMTHEVEGSHALISPQLAKRYGESQGVVHAN